MPLRHTIEEAGLPLAPVLTSLHKQSFGEEAWTLKQMQGSLELATTKAWIARERARPIGCILCQMLPGQMEILTFGVIPEKRRHGIGGSLIRHALSALIESGGGTLMLEVAADNLAARRLYEDHGMKITGTRANYYKRGAVTVDAVMYGILLD